MKTKVSAHKKDEPKIQTGFRASESLNKEIEKLSKDLGISKNAIMTMTINIGIKKLKSDLSE
jgi:hypothetical protein